MRFRVAKDMEPTEDAAVEDLGTVNMGAGEALADFVKWGWTNYPARRTMLVLWDHGQVYTTLTTPGDSVHGGTCHTMRTPATGSTSARSKTP